MKKLIAVERGFIEFKIGKRGILENEVWATSGHRIKLPIVAMYAELRKISCFDACPN